VVVFKVDLEAIAELFKLFNGFGALVDGCIQETPIKCSQGSD
jgi:hypothetical protein